MGIWIPHYIKGNYSYHSITNILRNLSREIACSLIVDEFNDGQVEYAQIGSFP